MDECSHHLTLGWTILSNTLLLAFSTSLFCSPCTFVLFPGMIPQINSLYKDLVSGSDLRECQAKLCEKCTRLTFSKPRFQWLSGHHQKQISYWGAWVAQLVKRPISAQVMISQLMGSSPTLGSLFSAKPVLDPLSALSPLPWSLSLSKINIKKKRKKQLIYTDLLFPLI